jgi:hypothetical protein
MGNLDLNRLLPSENNEDSRSAEQLMTFHGIELTNLYICLALWAVSGVHFKIFRHSSAVVFAACLGLPPFVSALVNLSLCGSGARHLYLSSWVRSYFPSARFARVSGLI